MPSTTFYRQCRLQKGNVEQVSYIPEPYCRVGQVLKLKDEQTWIWEDGWEIVWASKEKTPEDHLPDPHVQRKRHREATGDSLKR